MVEDKQDIYARILEHIDEAFYRTDADGRLVMVAGAAIRLIGYDSVEELIGTPAELLCIIPIKRPRYLKELEEHGGVRNHEMALRKKDGSPLHVEISSHLYHDEQGNVLGVEGVVRDISLRVNALKALEESEARYRGIVRFSAQHRAETGPATSTLLMRMMPGAG